LGLVVEKASLDNSYNIFERVADQYILSSSITSSSLKVWT